MSEATILSGWKQVKLAWKVVFQCQPLSSNPGTTELQLTVDITTSGSFTESSVSQKHCYWSLFPTSILCERGGICGPYICHHPLQRWWINTSHFILWLHIILLYKLVYRAFCGLCNTIFFNPNAYRCRFVNWFPPSSFSISCAYKFSWMWKVCVKLIFYFLASSFGNLLPN